MLMTQQFETRFLEARKKYIASHFQNLNEMQKQAVMTTDGPLLLLAGAGSGKTTVLINRVANLIRYGSGSDSHMIPDIVTEEDVVFLENLQYPISDFDRSRADFLCLMALNEVNKLLFFAFHMNNTNFVKISQINIV